jgi:hypothetical protein
MEARVGIEPTHKGFADLSLTTWVPRLNLSIIAKTRLARKHRVPLAARIFPVYFFLTGSSSCASRRNRADSSGGVGLI